MLLASACGFVFALALGCGGANPVDEIIKEQRAIIELQKSGKFDIERINAVEKKVAKLTTSQKEEYAKRMVAEMGAAVQDARKAIQDKIDDNLKKIKIPDVKLPEVPKIP